MALGVCDTIRTSKGGREVTSRPGVRASGMLPMPMPQPAILGLLGILGVFANFSWCFGIFSLLWIN